MIDQLLEGNLEFVECAIEILVDGRNDTAKS